ncbi:MAG: GIY-YIG nuclease family protein [Deltaproteobacteria bacterium]|nr:GIY-YIG nuclease family protein [Deltaproteobacteria bacterium]
MSTKLPIKKIMHGDYSYWHDGLTESIKCPECGSEYQHFGAPVIKTGNDNYEAGWPGRGDLLVIPISGECGSKWEICLGFHKGQTGAFINLLDSCKEPDCHVYIETVGLSRVKIGFSVNPEDRVKQLSTGSPTELKLIAKIPGGANDEKELHEKFKHLLFEKEWFHFTKELQSYIEELGSQTRRQERV